MTDIVPKRKMNPVCDGKWAGIDVGYIRDMRDYVKARLFHHGLGVGGRMAPSNDDIDDRVSRMLGIDVASIRRLAGELTDE